MLGFVKAATLQTSSSLRYGNMVMRAGMFRVVGVSGKQQEVQRLLDQLIVPGLTEQGAQ